MRAGELHVSKVVASLTGHQQLLQGLPELDESWEELFENLRKTLTDARLELSQQIYSEEAAAELLPPETECYQ